MLGASGPGCQVEKLVFDGLVYALHGGDLRVALAALRESSRGDASGALSWRVCCGQALILTVIASSSFPRQRYNVTSTVGANQPGTRLPALLRP